MIYAHAHGKVMYEKKIAVYIIHIELQICKGISEMGKICCRRKKRSKVDREVNILRYSAGTFVLLIRIRDLFSNSKIIFLGS